jgi:hypothetical protein
MNESPPVTVVVVAWNQLDRTLDCLDALARLTYPSARLLLVDNGSDPPLEETVRPRFPDVEVLRLPENRGFAGGYNAGIRRALEGDARLVCLLNNDTLPAPGFLDALVAEATTSTEIGLVTSKIYYAADPQRIWSVGHNVNVFLDLVPGAMNQLDAGQWDEARDIDFAPFCAVVLKREVVERVGLLDEAFFLYYEDMDYCLRMRRAGYRLRYQPAAIVHHAVAASTGGKTNPVRRYWLAQSGGRYFRKHGHGPRMALILPFRAASAAKMSARLLLDGDRLGLRAYWAGLVTGWRTGRADTPPPDWTRQPRPDG